MRKIPCINCITLPICRNVYNDTSLIVLCNKCYLIKRYVGIESRLKNGFMTHFGWDWEKIDKVVKFLTSGKVECQ